MASDIQRIIITTGDADGIGTEVTAKALSRLPLPKNLQYIVLRSAQTPPAHVKMMAKKYKRIQFDSLGAALAFAERKSNLLLDVVSIATPQDWVHDAATACVTGRATAIVTAPMSKKSMGGHALGHTEILKDVSKSPHVYMAFLGKHFNVVNCTGHIPLKDVSSKLTSDKILRACQLAHEFVQKLPARQRSKPLGLVGLNPHAGENGTIGSEESTVYADVCRDLDRKKIAYAGPLVPDVAFTKDYWSQYSFYISPYHDQALIPFKMLHGKSSGVHMTLGLPFVRTSVDHGTAKDIFNQNKADPGSMMDALKWAIQLTKSSGSKEKR